MASSPPAVRTEDDGAVRSLALCRPREYNTITPQLRDELAAVDEADRDPAVRVILGGLGGGPPGGPDGRPRRDRAVGRRPHRWYASKPTIAAPTAAALGLILEAVPDDELQPAAAALARHTPGGADFVRRSQEVGFREAVRERDVRSGTRERRT